NSLKNFRKIPGARFTFIGALELNIPTNTISFRPGPIVSRTQPTTTGANNAESSEPLTRAELFLRARRWRLRRRLNLRLLRISLNRATHMWRRRDHSGILTRFQKIRLWLRQWRRRDNSRCRPARRLLSEYR